MRFNKTVWAFSCILILTACGDNPSNNQEVNLSAESAKAVKSYSNVIDTVDAKNDTTEERDEIVIFQQEAIPIIEGTLIKHFPMEVNKTGTPTIEVDNETLLEQATSYFDNSDINNLKVVFLIDKEYTKEMKAIRIELEDKLGEKVIFKKAKHNPKMLRDTTYEIRSYLDKLIGEGKSTVSYNTKDETIEIIAKLSEEQIVNLNNEFGANILEITNEEPPIGILLSNS